MTAQIISLRKVEEPHVRCRPYKKPSPERQKDLDGFTTQLGERLRFARTQLNISEEEAAHAFGVTVRTYRRYEAAKPGSWTRGPIFYYASPGGLIDFADIFGVSLNWLCGCKGTEAEAPRFRLRAL
jgi:transcriptional regulator with XRE-family HTH domain